MKSLTSIPWLSGRRRWVACVDLLGFRNIVQNKIDQKSDWPTIASLYSQVLDELTNGPASRKPVQFAWFSDTFLLYTENDNPSDLAAINLCIKWFTRGLIWRYIPFRGALSCGDLLAYKEEAIFIGAALVDAYALCENQNWIGFALHESAEKQIQSLGFTPERLEYRRWDIPRKAGNGVHSQASALFLGFPCSGLTTNDPYKWLSTMRDSQTVPEIRVKYENTLVFLEHCVRLEELSTFRPEAV